MSNYSEGTQVPFGDGSHVPPEEVTDWDFESDTTMHTAMKNIFLSCDQDNSDSARVSDLINFMIPHMQEHTSQLTMLKIALDPNDIDPYVTSETFYKMMMKWTTQFMEESVKSDEDKNSSVRELQKGKEKGSPHSSVLSKSSVGKRFLKGCIESDSTSLNLSNNSSTNSCTENSVIDVSMLQEKINELEHQNRKLTEELEHSRSQLTSSEEQNESLHGEVQKLARRLLGEQQTVSQLEKDRQNTEELMEASSTAQKQLNKLEKDLASSEKQVSKLKQQINNLEVENQKFEDKIEQLVKRDTVSKQSIQKLQTELQIKEQEYSSLEDAYGQANVRLSEQRQLVTHYVNVNKTLKDDKIKMEKQYCEAMKTRISSTHAKVPRTFSESSVSSKSGTYQYPSNLIPEKESQQNSDPSVNTQPISNQHHYHSPLKTLYKNKGFVYNSPRTLHMVANPVSPNLDNSTIASSACCKKSVDSDDSPYFMCDKHQENPAFVYTSSTPGKLKTILDQTPPSAVRKLPRLSPTKPVKPTIKSPSIKKDLKLFRQYRFVGSSSDEDEEEVNHQTTEDIKPDLLSASQIKQEYDANLNIISAFEEKHTLSLGSVEEENKESSLPTMYVVEHSCDRRRSKSASSGSPTNLRNIVDSSYEDDPLLWNSNQKVAPHESLECEISQANLVDTEKATLRNTVQGLQEENNRLKIQLANNTEKVKIYSPERRDHYYETEIKALKDKIQELESDNNQKYIKIVDLMVETESLKRELKRINTKDTDEIKKLQQNISELHHDKKNILRDLQQQKCEKQNYDSIIINVQSIKHECDILQNLLQHSKQNGEDLCNDLVKISGEKYGLKSKVDKLQQSVCEMKDKNKSLNIQLQCFSNEYVKLKKNIKLKSPDELGLRRPHDYVNPAINEELSSKQNGHVLDATYKENEKALRLLEEERNTLKNRITQHESIIVLLKKEITDLSANNSKLSQNTGEKETQIVLLKQIIAHQNDNIKEITTDKDTGTVKLYEQKCENEILYEKNKELTKNINETVKQLDLAQKENEYLCVRISNLEEENKSILAEFKIITGDYKKIKDSDNELMKEYKSLVADKEILANKFETLTNDYKKMKELKEDIEQQLQEMKKQAADLSSPKQHSPLLREGTKLSSPKRKYKEEAQDHNRYTKALTKIQEKLATLEYTNKQLQSENKKLQEEFNQITNTYESLAREKEIWAMEKNEWSELKDELSQKLTKAMSESKLLEEQLYHTKQASLESLHKTNSNISCSNCPILKNEIADLTTRLNELQKQNTKIIQSRRYDRMQTTIEKLKSKSFGTEEELKREKEKFANLQLENFKLKADVDENRKKYEQEREVLEVENTKLDNEIKVNLNHYNTERKDLALKQSNLEEQLKNLQKYVIELEQERNFVTQECNSLKEKLEVSLKEKENRVKSINKETNQLKQEIQELTKQKTKLEKKLATADNLLKCKLNVDKINKENSQLKQEIEEANKQISDLEKKLEKAEQDLKEKLDAEQKLKDFQVSASQEKLNIEEQLEELQKKLEKTQRDLQKSEARNLSIRKELVDKQTAKDAIQCSECSATTEQLVDENYNLQKQLKDYEYELAEIQIKLNESNSSLLSLSEHVTDVNQKLNEKRLKLNRSTLTAVNNWRTILENEPDKKPVLEIFDEEEPPAPRQLFVGPLDEEIHKFKYQIHVTSLILDTLGKLKISRLSMTSSGDVEPQSATVSTSTPQKCKKKFIPKTKTVMSRSSSPTQKAKGQTTDTSLVKSRTCPTLPALNAEASGTNDAKLSRFVRPNSPTKNKVQSKPTSGLSTQSRDSSPVNKSKSYVCSENTCYCRINNDFVCYNSQDDVYMEGNILSEDEEVELGLGSNNNSPSLSSGTLESLGLLYEGASPSWSKKEIEEKFHILVTCFMMDVVTIKERSKKQQIYQSKMESKFTVESEKVLTLLKDMKQLDRDPQIKLLVTTCLGHIKRMVGIFSLTATLATQFGALQHEQQSLKIISVMINHAANLRRVLENASPRLKCIGPSTSSPKQSQARVLSHNSGIVQLNVSSLFDSPQVIFNEVKELNGIHHHTPSLGPSGEEEKTDDDSNTEPDLTQNRLFFYFLVVLAIIAFLMVGVNFSSYTNFSECGGLWRCASWDDLFAPFIKRTYQGPVPT